MARTVARRRFAARPERRRRTWARHSFTQQFTSAGNAIAFDLLGGWFAQVEARLPGLTVGPVRGSLDIPPPAAASQFFWGLIVANREAIAGDITAFDPSQMADRTLDWMWWGCTGMTTVALGDQSQHLRYETFSRRKITRVGESLFFIGRAVTTATSSIVGTHSTLVLLP